MFTPAKLNLYLEILGRRDDGFHELDTLMTPVRIFDHLRWSPLQDDRPAGFSLAYHPATPPHLAAAAPADSANLVWRAFHALGRAAGIEPWGNATLLKRIPVQAGLGGASSDAAAALVLANAAWQVNYSRRRLAALAAELGSDVPFFLAGGAAVCRGRGEQVTPIAGIPRLHVVVAKPPAGVSTAAAYGSLQAPAMTAAAARDSQAHVEQLLQDLQHGALARAARNMVNRLEDAAAGLCPWIARLRDAFADCSVLGRQMTGSGSAYFAIVRSAREARRVAGRIWSMFERGGGSSDAGGWGRGRSGIVFATATCRTASPPL
jgi:4-diphosphocytidyl-2-C-methyl-D-erythritol kinase